MLPWAFSQRVPGLPPSTAGESWLNISGAVLGDDTALYLAKEAGKRMADALNAHVVFTAGSFGRWVAIRLEDGSSDGVLYDTRADAIRHQLHDTLCWYEPIRPSSYSPDECALLLVYARAAYDAGWRPERDAPAPILPVRHEDGVRKIRQLTAARKR